uniref:Elongation of very long chain fatty acids protein n=1 Tax=Mola mola TaxID=94237 RepID=A0A3Q3VPA0_MOLML
SQKNVSTPALEFWDSFPFARVRHYPLMQNPVEMTSILAMIINNLSMVLLNAYIVCKVHQNMASCVIFVCLCGIPLFVRVVLRMKRNQITFLQVFHDHAKDVIVVGGMASLHSVVNGIAHILMYFYYGLFAAGPRFHKDMRCKKYKTSIQLTQFTLVSIHIGQYHFMKNYVQHLVLFFNFWIKAYIKNHSIHLSQAFLHFVKCRNEWYKET